MYLKKNKYLITFLSIFIISCSSPHYTLPVPSINGGIIYCQGGEYGESSGSSSQQGNYQVTRTETTLISILYKGTYKKSDEVPKCKKYKNINECDSIFKRRESIK